MIIDCIADLHGFYPKLEGGDLLIVVGDCTASDRIPQWKDFFDWLKVQAYRKKILIAGNHDGFLSHCINEEEAEKMGLHDPDEGFTYLCDSGCEFEGLKIWGSPWTTTFPGMNPKCKAFTVDSDEELAEKWKIIPSDINILVTHSPPFGVFDCVYDFYTGKSKQTGSQSLSESIKRIKPDLHIFGHIHEGYNRKTSLWPSGKTFTETNCSHVNEHYEPVNKPVRIIL